MKNAILIPGRPDRDQHYDPKLPNNSENYWFSWLKRQLILQDILTDSIEPPMPFRPRYADWKREFERFDLTKETILVGHSCGGGFLVRYLSEHKELEFGQVVLVAPWINPDNNEASETADFFDFKIDPDFPSRAKSVTVFVSADDDPSVLKTVEILKQQVRGLDIRQFQDRRHFKTSVSGGPEFPELLAEITQN